MPDHFLPLRAVRVLDLSRVLAGPVCSMVLADLGADVIKVERPGQGDDTRAWGPPFIEPPSPLAGMSAYFASVNRTKRSLALDLSRPAGRQILDRLIARSHVLLENFLPSSADKLGLNPDRLRQLNPHLVACSISGFGRTGPWRDQPGYDFVIQALSGLMSITGGSEPGAPGMKVGVALTDVLTGLYAAVAILAALGPRKKDGRPQQPASNDEPDSFRHIDLALLDCTVASLVNIAQSFLITGQSPIRYGNAHPQIVPYESFETSDGSIALAVGNDEQFVRFCSAAGCPELADDVRFCTNPARVSHRDQLIPRLQQVFRTSTTESWLVRLRQAQVPHAPVLSLPDVFSLEPLRARAMVQETDGMKMVASPIRVTEKSPRPPLPPPRLGQHTADVLRDFGYTPQEIECFRADGVLGATLEE